MFPKDQRTGEIRKVTIGEWWLIDRERSDDHQPSAQLIEELPPQGMSAPEIIADLTKEALISDTNGCRWPVTGRLLQVRVALIVAEHVPCALEAAASRIADGPRDR